MKTRILDFRSALCAVFGVGLLAVASASAQTLPSVFDLSSGDYSFTAWADTSTAGTYPANMGFHRTGTQDPGLAVEMTADYTAAYNGTSGSRINGVGADGVTFVNTGSSGNIGAAVVGLNTTGRNNVQVSWLGGTHTAGARVYALRLQYRVGAGSWADVSGPVEYSSSGQAAGHTTSFGPTTLPEACNNQAAVYLRWKYYSIPGGSGTRPRLRLDEISVTSSSAVAPVIASPATGSTAVFTATYGAPSATQSFTVTASDLSANLVATAPTGFQVTSNGGTTWGTTATFTPSSGSVDGTLGVRLSATASATGSYDAAAITLVSGTASVTLTTPGGGNTVTPAALTVTANPVTKPFGQTLTTPVIGSTAFTTIGLVNDETADSVTITYLDGFAAGDMADTYTGAVVPSDLTGGTFTASNYDIDYVAADLTVTADPTIAWAGTVSALTTTYGTASANAEVTIAGGNLTGDLTITAPAGFEVSGSADGPFDATATFTPTEGGVDSSVFVRITAATAPGAASAGQLTASTSGADDAQLAVPAGTVTPKPLTVTGLAAADKEYDRTTDATVTGTPALEGVIPMDEVSVTGTASGVFAGVTAGTEVTVNVSGLSLDGAEAARYSLTAPVLAADITPKVLTVTGAAVITRDFNGGDGATITGTLDGVIAPDVVTLIGSGTFENNGPGVGIAVTSTSTLGGADAGNYTLEQPVGLTGTITPAQVVFTEWTFEPTATPATAPEPSTGTGTAAIVGSLSGAGGSSGTVTGEAQQSGTNAWAFSTANPGSANESSGVEFKTSTVGYENLRFSFDQRFSGTSARTVRVQYTLDGTTWVNFDVDPSNFTSGSSNKGGIDLGRIDTSNPVGNNASDVWNRRTIDFSGVTGATNNPNFGIRILAAHYSTTGQFRQTNNVSTAATGGTWRFDNIRFSGNELPYGVVSTVPADSSETVPVNATVAIYLSAASTFEAGAVTIEAPAGTPVAFTGMPDPSAEVSSLLLTPTAPLPFNTVVTVTLDKDKVASGAGALADDYSFSFTTTPPVPPVFAQPADQTIAVNGTAEIEVVVTSGSAPFSYQWFAGATGDDSTPVGTDANTFTTPALTTTGDYEYWVRVTNVASQSVDSATITVTVIDIPFVTGTTPADAATAVSMNDSIVINFSKPVSLTAGAIEIDPPASFTGLPATTTDTVTLLLTSPLSPLTEYTVTVKAAEVTDSAMDNLTADYVFSFTTEAAAAPVITAQPTNGFVPAGTDAQLTVSATGKPAPSYQWYAGATGDLNNPVGGNSATLTVTNMTQSASYWVRVSNSESSVDSATATLIVFNSTPAAFTKGNLAALMASSVTNNSSTAIIELRPEQVDQSPVQTLTVPVSGPLALRISGSATSTGYLSNSDDGTLLAFTGHASATTTGNINAVISRAVGVFDPTGGYDFAAVYEGVSGQQTRGASSLNNTDWIIGDQSGIFTNDATAPDPAGNIRSVKSFGGTVYAFRASTSLPPVSVISAPSSGTLTGLPGLPNGSGSYTDFYLVSSGANGASYDVLYMTVAGLPDSGSILKYSLVGGSWVAKGSHSTNFGGFGLVAAPAVGGVNLYLTTGNGALPGNKVIGLFDSAEHDEDIAIDDLENLTLYTAPLGTTLKGLAFAPAAASQPVQITGQPASQSIASGAIAELTVTATGTGPLSYQWYEGVSGDTSAPVGTDSATFTTPNLTVETSYWVRVSNAVSQADSDTAVVALSAVPTIAFSQPVFSFNQGDVVATLSVSRTGQTHPVSVVVETSNGTTSAVPPFSPALAGTDYQTLSTVLNFAEGEMSQTLDIVLVPRTNAPNLRLTATLSSPTGGAVLGVRPTAEVRVLATDTLRPTLTVTSPAGAIAPATSVNVSAAWPFVVRGTAGDLRGVDRVEVALNGGTPTPAVLGSATVATSVPFSLPLEPENGPNTVVVTAYDLRGNSTTLTRNFMFTRRYPLVIARVVPAGLHLTPDAAGTVAMVATPSAGASTLSPATANTDPKSSQILPGTVVRLTAAAKAGYAFSHWTGLPDGAVLLGNVATFTMPAADVGSTAVFVQNPFVGAVGTGTQFFGLIRPSDGVDSRIGSEGFLTGTLTATTGAFTGRVLVDGVSQAISATFYGNGSAIFTVGTARHEVLSFGGRTLTLSYNAAAGNDQITATLTHAGGVSTGVARRAIYSAANRVPGALLNASAVAGGAINRGVYTVVFPAKIQDPVMATADYPQGTGFAVVTLTDAGAVTAAGTLADGTLFSGSSALLSGNECPIFAQLSTPGQPSAVRGGVFLGTLVFDPTQPDTDLAGTDFVWMRPNVTGLVPTATAAARAAADLYTQGWPSGIKVDALGALFDRAKNVQQALDLDGPSVDINGQPLGYEDGKLVFSEGKLTSSITKQNFIVAGNVVTKLPSTDTSYTLTLAPTSGAFSGSFRPNWPSPVTALPAFRGIMLQKGAHKGGHGFFISNASADPDPQAGDVNFTLEPDTAAVSPIAFTAPPSTATSISSTSPFTLRGTAGNARGLVRVEVVLNGGDPVNAVLGTPGTGALVPFSLVIAPLTGSNTIVITAVDLRGNRSSVTQTFTFHRRYELTLTRTVPAGLPLESVGTVALTATPSTQATALAPTTAGANPRTAAIQLGTSVRLTATPKVGYAFSHWTGLPDGVVDQGNVVSFAMPTEDLSITAHFVANTVFAGALGRGAAFHGLIRPEAGTPTSNATVGYLSGTLNATTGAFTGTVLMDGVSRALSATFYGNGSVFFTVGTARLPTLSFAGKTLSLSYNAGAGNDTVTAVVTQAAGTSGGTAQRSIYSQSNPVPAALLNQTTSGFFTLGLSSKTQAPPVDPAFYPQGDGYATLTVLPTGVVNITGLLADGTSFMGSSGIVPGNECPIFVQLVTPGASTTVRGGSFGGTLVFDTTPADSDVSGMDLLWIRPTVTQVLGTSVNARATQIYTNGWPLGITVDAVGALYSKTVNVQTALGLAAPNSTTGNAQLLFTEGKLTTPIIRSRFNVTGNTVAKIPTTDTRYTLTLTPNFGTFNGTFTPNWLAPAVAKPAFRGILIQKGANKAGFGFFISNAVGDTDPESGSVTLSAQ